MSTTSDNPARSRVLSLKGGCNFRDIGGYRTINGRMLRWGQVYRTAVLTYFTADDHAPLHELKVRAICDLRRAEERLREPTRWPAHASLPSPELLNWDDGTQPPTLRSFANIQPTTAAGMFDAMIDLYRALPTWMAARLRGMFDCIASDKLPMVVHCAAGKDRTGIAIALLMTALGVPRDTVIEDYLLTNDAGDFEQFIRSRHDAQLGLTDEEHPLLLMPPDVRRVLFSADAAFLEAAFEQIERQHGGVDAYLEKTIGISDAARERVITALLA